MENTEVSSFVTLADGLIASDYSLKNLNQSLGTAQSEFSPALKSEENKWGGYKYTPLESIIKAVRPSLTKNHLTMSQYPITDLETKVITMITRLVHWDSGEWIQHTFDLPGELALGKDGAAKFNQQTIGGSSTYAQKYAYKTILGVPDAEELIDSTDEKGDLPSRSKAQRYNDQKKFDRIGTRHPQEGSPQFGEAIEDRNEPSPQPAQPILKKENPDPTQVQRWLDEMIACTNIDEFNQNVVQRSKDEKRGREFVIMMATEAKNRGYKVDRATGLYVEGGTQ